MTWVGANVWRSSSPRVLVAQLRQIVRGLVSTSVQSHKAAAD